MPADTKDSTAMEVEVSESKTPKRSTRAAASTPKTDTKKPVQAKLSNYFSKATPKADGMKSPKKEVLSPEKETRTSPRKSQGGKKEEKKKEEKKRSINAKKDAEEKEKEEENEEMGEEKEKEIKKEVKEEPLSEDELMGDNSDHEDEEEAFEVEKILSHKWSRGKVLYKVKWVGFDTEEDNTFEPASNLDTATEILKNYIESLPEEEQEKINGKKKERPAKRPLSATQPKEKEVAEKKKKEPEAKKGKTATPKGAKDSKPIAKIFQKSQKANAAKATIQAEVKEENNVEEKLEYIRQFRDKAIAYMAPDAKDPVGPIGLVFQKAAEVLITMIESNAEPEAMRVANEALKSERAQVQPNDKEENEKELRGVIYGVFESLETAMDHIIKKEEESLAPSAPASIVASDTNTSAVKTECDTDSMFAVSTAVVKKEVKIEEEDEEEIGSAVDGFPTESADREIKMEA